MLLLAIDVGNTKVAIGVYSGDTMVHNWRISTGRNKTEDEYGMLLMSLLRERGVSLKEIDGAVLACVVPPVTPVLEKTISKYLGVEPLIVGPGVKTGINIKYENPKEVGPDRIAHAVAALKKYGAPLVVIDFGTATTFDAISSKGEYLGGIISPGIQTSLEALFEKAARLPRIELSKPPRAIGKTSAESMQSGMVYGFAGMVDSLVKRLTVEMKAEPYVVATGDFAEMVSQESESIKVVDPFLALDGLRLIHQMNRPSNPGDS
jgi:type III pantothenate kinase